MKTFRKSKYALSVATLATLAACGGDDDNKPQEPNVAPQMVAGESANLVFETLTEDVSYASYKLLENVFDANGDFLKVQNITSTGNTDIGFSINESRVHVDMTELAPILDTGDMITVTYNFDISDGTEVLNRTFEITVEGRDFAPEFEDLAVVFADLSQAQELDLLTGVTDADNEELSTSDVVTDMPADRYTVEGNVMTIDTTAWAGELEEGETANYTIDYVVSDHNHDLPRTGTIIILNGTTEPLPPTVKSNYTASFDTDGDVTTVDLASPIYVIEENGDPLTIEFDTITPVGDAPAIKFTRSAENILLVDPVDFALHMDTIDATGVYRYTYDITDGDNPDTGGHTTNTWFELTVTRKANSNLIENYSFEDDGFPFWSTDGGWQQEDATMPTHGTDTFMSGVAHMDNGTVALWQDFSVKSSANYFVQFSDYSAGWQAMAADLTWGAESFYRYFKLHPPFVGGAETPFPSYKLQAMSFTVGADESNDRTLSFYINQWKELDEVYAGRFSIDGSNNAVYMAGATNFDFEDGIGNWVASSEEGTALTTAGDEVLGGNQSLTLTGWNALTLTLPAGTIENGKTYLLSFDVRVLTSDGDGSNNPMAAYIADAADDQVTVFADKADFELLAQPRMRNFFPEDANVTPGKTIATTKYEQIIDVDRFTTVTDWASRTVNLTISPNLWTPDKKISIDNVMLVEVQLD
ncbi:hypothetical protein [Agaribacterium sp. ZY112]|uniref:hypothetical protein n=1 Tax=Agaribacterium sp. ZY112 TaxID=3233574 RepID=UPI003523D972